MLSKLEVDYKRGRSSSSSMSYTSTSSHNGRHQRSARLQGNNDRHQTSSVSPDAFGRKRQVRNRSADRPISSKRKTNYSRSRSMTYDSSSSYDKTHRIDSQGEDRSKRRRHLSRSPDDRGRVRDFYGKRGSRRTRSPCESRDRSEVTRNRKSMTPSLLSRQDDSSTQHDKYSHRRGQGHTKDDDRYGVSARDRYENTHQSSRFHPTPRKQRSLSPFSKRLALTQAMNRNR